MRKIFATNRYTIKISLANEKVIKETFVFYL